MLAGFAFADSIVQSAWAGNDLRTEAVALELDAPHSGYLDASDSQSFYISLAPRRAYLVELSQDGLDYAIEIQFPGGATTTFNSPLLRLGPERLLLDAAVPGRYVFRIQSSDYKGAPGSYRISVSSLPSTSEHDKSRIAAMRLETEAASLYFGGGADAWQKVADHYGKAAERWGSISDKRFEARARLAQSRVLYSEITNWEQAIKGARTAAALYQDIGATSDYASAIHLQAAALIEAATESGDPATSARMFDDAQTLFSEAAEIKSASDEHFEAARILNDAGLGFHFQGRWDEAVERYRQAAETFHEEQEWGEEFKPVANLATIAFDHGQLTEALVSYERLLEVLPPDDLLDFRGHVLDNMGMAYRSLGRFEESVDSYFAAIQLHGLRGEMKAEGHSLSGLGTAYYSAGNPDLAREYLERALRLHREANDGRSLMRTLRYLGQLRLERGDIEGAIKMHREAVAIATAPVDIALAQVHLGHALALSGQSESALVVLTEAVEQASANEATDTLAHALTERGIVLLDSGDTESAHLDLTESLRIYEEFNILTGMAHARFGLARVAHATNHLDEAIDHSLQSLDLIERLRGEILNPDLRAGYFGTRRNYYDFYIHLLMQRHVETGDASDLYAALEASERAHSRAMLDLLAESVIDIRHGISPELRVRHRMLLQQLAELRYRQSELFEENRTHIDLEPVLAELQRVETELDVFQAEVRRSNPRYAELSAPQLLSATEIQAALDDETVLLEYALGTYQSYVFVVTQSDISAHRLPPRQTIEALARSAHSQLQTRRSSQSDRDELDSALRDLAAAVVEPIRQSIDRPRLLVIPDGALHYVPFSVLPLFGTDDVAQRLLSDFEVVNAASMTAVALRRETTHVRSKESRTVAVFADPVFEHGDSRLSNVDTADVTTSDVGPQLSRLPATANEAAVISSLVAEDQRFVATGFAANRTALLDAELGNYRIIHFATHGIVDARYPLLSALAVSNYDSNGERQEGLLRLHDIYNLRINADLVVLSACDTALGREVRGEGLIGLTRGFLYAGSGSVVASLWQVPDSATAELMKHFYTLLLSGESNPATALRQAQLEIASDRRWRDPYFWGAFVIQGDWLSTDQPPKVYRSRVR